MAEMKPPSSHRSSVALVYAAKMWSTPNWKRSFAGQFFSTHQGCSLLLRIHTTAEKDEMRRPPLRIGRSKDISTPTKTNIGSINKPPTNDGLEDPSPFNWEDLPAIVAASDGHASSHLPGIFSTWASWLRITWYTFGWNHPSQPPKNGQPWRFWVGIFWAFVFVRILMAMNICWEGFEAQGIAWRSAG